MDQQLDFSTLNKSLVIKAATLFLMIVGLLACITRISMKWFTVRSLGLDDQLAVGATCLAVAQSIVVVEATSNGLGKHVGGLQAGQIDHVLKSEYAAHVIFIASLTLAKLSAITTLWALAPLYHRRTVVITSSLVVAWTLSSILPALLQCQMPRPWDYISGQCFQRAAFWMYVSVGNIVTDVAIVVIMTTIFVNLQLPLSKKLLVGGIFGSRILVTPAIIGHISTWHEAITNPGDATFRMVMPTILAELVQCLSILTACLPYLKPFLDSFQSGAMVVVDATSQNARSKGSKAGTATSAAYGGNSKNDTSTSNNNNNHINHNNMNNMNNINQHHHSQSHSQSRSHGHSYSNSSGHGRAASGVTTPRGHPDEFELADMPSSKTATTVTANQGMMDAAMEAWDGQSHTSQTVLVQQSWQVDIEHNLPARGNGRRV
ncbi:uncharacterized protein MAM_07390 [Metarhizium album ARSEF 1941]|uniref:Integral membrane protein n=1 Tax=Metarhizium album (strain ARSEF 1941) TaxID=1081103 RepID=A0A0B2WMB5_METAS|nr:uncharacterized protein MAM_07390 [Metarhizium album ARSEF 1941]KHN94794.1 integral membrane protein [Metarhizium album ARSEF 1941]